MSDNIHKSHRERLRKKFLKVGLENFESHEILELLLFYAIPQRDLNPLAHSLVNKFGSLSAVIDANFEELIKIPGITEYAATLIKLIPKISMAYNVDKIDGGKPFDNIEKIGEFCVYKYFGETKEKISVILLDNRFRMLGYEVLGMGSQGGAIINYELLGEIIFRYNASLFILIHNHPGGNLEPSKEDAELTQYVSSIMSHLNKYLVEHILVVDDRYLPLMQYLRQRGYYFYDG